MWYVLIIFLIILMDLVSDDLIMAMSQNMNPEHVSVCNNAIWALGEVAIRLGILCFLFSFCLILVVEIDFFSGAEIRQFIPMFLETLIVLINRPNTQKTLLENTGLLYICFIVL